MSPAIDYVACGAGMDRATVPGRSPAQQSIFSEFGCKP